jgi:hypothetical protein
MTVCIRYAYAIAECSWERIVHTADPRAARVRA